MDVDYYDYDYDYSQFYNIYLGAFNPMRLAVN